MIIPKPEKIEIDFTDAKLIGMAGSLFIARLANQLKLPDLLEGSLKGVKEDNQKRFSITAMCRVMSVSTTGFYDWCSRPESNRSQEDRALKADIRVTHKKHRQRYGERP